MIVLFPKLLAKYGILVVGIVGTVIFGALLFYLPFTPNITVVMFLMAFLGSSNGLQMNVSTIVRKSGIFSSITPELD